MTTYRSFEDIIDKSCCSKKFSESKMTQVRLFKVVKLEAILGWLGVSFLKKWRICHFPAIKTDSSVERCSSYYQLKALIIYNPKHMHSFAIRSLDHSRFGFEVTCWRFKKSFFLNWKLLRPSKKLFLKRQKVTSNPNLEWSKLRMAKLCICFGLYMIRAFNW